MSKEQVSEQEELAADAVKVEVRTTADGSVTLYVPALNEHYHSTHGARQESMHVFIEAGLRPLLVAGGSSYARPWRILEVGLGTGLNALLTLQANQQAPTESFAEYDALETFPLPPAVTAALRPEWDQQGAWLGRHFEWLHAAPWDMPVEMTPWFTIQKMQQSLLTAHLPASRYHLIYFDAFAPEKQPELWTEEVFTKLYAAAAPGAVLVSYCAQGQFRRNLRAAGWLTEKLPGPPGKREMTRARKAV
ncbi:MAG: tRNA (5-methylaminomethyl-2-thiouridine)(34)-methyltransferase MnmD [Janthinobacterium lividum]